MTGPNDPSTPIDPTKPIDAEASPPEPGPTPAAASIEPDLVQSEPGLVPSEPGLVPAAPTTSAGWAPPPAQGSGIGLAKGCAIVAAIVVAVGGLLLTLAVVALIFLGGQVASILQGTVQFGTGGSECSVTGVASTFPATTPIHLAAHLERTVAAGEVITMVVTGPDGEDLSTDEPPAPTSFECIYNDITPGLPPGSYAIEFLVGQERLATGSFQITP